MLQSISWTLIGNKCLSLFIIITRVLQHLPATEPTETCSWKGPQSPKLKTFNLSLSSGVRELAAPSGRMRDCMNLKKGGIFGAIFTRFLESKIFFTVSLFSINWSSGGRCHVILKQQQTQTHNGLYEHTVHLHLEVRSVHLHVP